MKGQTFKDLLCPNLIYHLWKMMQFQKHVVYLTNEVKLLKYFEGKGPEFIQDIKQANTYKIIKTW